MIKIIHILNQVQAGIGGEERANIPPAGKKSPLGPGVMMEPHLKGTDAQIISTLYCGDQYFLDHREDVTAKMVAMVKKLEADVVICGPALNYPRFGEMAAYLAKAIHENTDIPAFAAMSIENPATELYRKDIYIIKTPKKGGTGLTDSLKKICSFAIKLASQSEIVSSELDGYFPRH